ncbi:Gibberellin 2-beta-dioxygenase [Turnera subulata]|uniref:gibberellin 2beta-dioxygenase n=1 Tax=Turnera subulata TaxID=218843 RepID=A0A9Q0FJQ6_9ROSI|nr:Gibberellin 2-beta-dioxygenase [Turnera subulata]
MVVLSQSAFEQFCLIKSCKPTSGLFSGIPVIDLRDPEAKTLIVKACEEFGFFKLVNHGVPLEFMLELESLAANFFELPQSEKDKAGPLDPYGYGNKRIGPNGDVGWIEYILLNANTKVTSQKSLSIFRENPEIFRSAVENYLLEAKRMSFEVLELMADGLGIAPMNVLSRMLKDEKSDSCFRLNYYPSCPDHLQALGGRNLIGFGEHTDPQIISVLTSNNTTGLQICLRDGTWVAVPPDQTAFYINVGDTLQVMTNGRFRSVKHRVVTDEKESRLSMIYFGGPSLDAKIAPIPSLVPEGEESLYREYTWVEYKQSVYKSRLGDNRLTQFERTTGH